MDESGSRTSCCAVSVGRDSLDSVQGITSSVEGGLLPGMGVDMLNGGGEEEPVAMETADDPLEGAGDELGERAARELLR